MSIFGAMHDFCTQKVENLLDRVSDVLRKATTVVNALDQALDAVQQALIAVENGLNTLANLANNAADTVRLNPLGSGPLKIVFKLVATFLRGAQRLFDGAAAAVKRFRQTVHTPLRRRVSKLLERINEKLIRMVMLVGDIQMVVRQIEEHAAWLATQEHLLPEDVKRLIQDEFARLFYTPVPGVDSRISAALDEVERIKQSLDAKMQEIKDALEVTSGVARAIAAIQNTIGSVFQRIADLGRAIKAFIDEHLSVVGWLLDAMEWVIEKAFEVLGVNAVVDWIRQRLGNVPFVREAQEFIALIERITAAVEAELNKLMARLESIASDLAEGVSDTLDQHSDGTLEYILRIVTKKLCTEVEATRQASRAADETALLINGILEDRDVSTAALTRALEVLNELIHEESRPYFFQPEVDALRELASTHPSAFDPNIDLSLAALKLREQVLTRVVDILQPASAAYLERGDAYFREAVRRALLEGAPLGPRERMRVERCAALLAVAS